MAGNLRCESHRLGKRVPREIPMAQTTTVVVMVRRTGSFVEERRVRESLKSCRIGWRECMGAEMHIRIPIFGT